MSIPVNPDATPEDEKNTFEKYIEILEYVKRVRQFPVTYTGPHLAECNELIADTHLMGTPVRDDSGEIVAVTLDGITASGLAHLRRLRGE